MRFFWGVISTFLLNNGVRKIGHPLSGQGYLISNSNRLTDFFNIRFVNILRTLKLKLKGKTLKIKKVNSKTFYLKLGITHPAISFIFFNNFFKKRAKQKFFFFGYSNQTMVLNSKDFTN